MTSNQTRQQYACTCLCCLFRLLVHFMTAVFVRIIGPCNTFFPFCIYTCEFKASAQRCSSINTHINTACIRTLTTQQQLINIHVFFNFFVIVRFPSSSFFCHLQRRWHLAHVVQPVVCTITCALLQTVIFIAHYIIVIFIAHYVLSDIFILHEGATGKKKVYL